MQFQRNFANLVKEQGPTRRDLEAPGPISDRASESALGVAEEFAFVEFGRDGSAVDANQC